MALERIRLTQQESSRLKRIIAGVLEVKTNARIWYRTGPLVELSPEAAGLLSRKVPADNPDGAVEQILAQSLSENSYEPLPGRSLLSLVIRSLVQEVADRPTLEFLNNLFLGYPLEESKIEPLSKLPDSDWRADQESGLQVLAGDPNFQPASFLQAAAEAAEAVCLVSSYWQKGTGFLVGPDLVLTCDHVLRRRDGKDLSAETLITFRYQEARGGGMELPVPFKTDPTFGPINGRAQGLDYAILRLDLSAGPVPGQALPLPLSRDPVAVDDPVSIIQHPDGKPKVICQRNNLIRYVDPNLIQYSTSTLPGSSGSPILSDGLQVVGLHRRGSKALREPSTGLLFARNEGLPAANILDNLAAYHPDVLGAIKGSPGAGL